MLVRKTEVDLESFRPKPVARWMINHTAYASTVPVPSFPDLKTSSAGSDTDVF